ncbi:MAG: hypothetical protein V3V31_11120 [Methylococcales bacterium]
MIEKSDSKWISLATVSILGQPPSPSRKSTHSKRAFLSAKGIVLFSTRAVYITLLGIFNAKEQHYFIRTGKYSYDQSLFKSNSSGALLLARSCIKGLWKSKNNSRRSTLRFKY